MLHMLVTASILKLRVIFSHIPLIWLQEVMLKKGLAWHYASYDKRPELANVSYILPYQIYLHS